MVEEGSQVIENNTSWKFHSKGFLRWGFWQNIWLTVIVSMTVMTSLMAMGIPVIVSGLLFVAIMFGMMQILSGKMIYELTELGISQNVTPNLNKSKAFIRTFTWDDIKSYERGTDLNRSKSEYNYLYIDLRIAPGQLRLSDDKADKKMFEAFANAFERLSGNDVVEVNLTGSQKEIVTSPETEPTPAIPNHIKKKKTFYQTIFAKVLTILFIVLCGFLIDFSTRNEFSEFNWFRLNIIVIPGTLYMIYRVFFSKK